MKSKKILALILAVIMMFALVACNETKAEVPTETEKPTEAVTLANGEKIKVAAIKGPTAMGMIELMDDEKYEFTLTSDPTEVVGLMSTGKVDIAACPLNLAANLYKKTSGNIQMIGINTLGTLYFVENTAVAGDAISVTDLKSLEGQTIYSTGQGATPEYIINHLFAENGMEVGKDVKVEYLSEHSELATKIAAGEVKYAILPEPFVSVATSKNADVKVQLSLTDEWNKISPDTQLAMGCVIASKAFVEENPEIIDNFIAENKASVDFVNNDTATAAPKLVEKTILSSEAIVMSATENCNIVFIDGDEMQSIADANFNVYFNADPISVGGAIPDAGLYYISK